MALVSQFTNFALFSHTTTPVGNITPTAIGDKCVRTDTGLWYYATGVTTADWQELPASSFTAISALSWSLLANTSPALDIGDSAVSNLLRFITTTGAAEIEYRGDVPFEIVTGGFTLTAGAMTKADGVRTDVRGAGTGTGDIVQNYGGTTTEGWQRRVYEATVSPAAVETNLLNLPAFGAIVSIQANVQTALTGGGTTVTFSIGTAADPDKYGTAGTGTAGGVADTLTLDAKLNFFPVAGKVLETAAEQIVLTGAATGGAADGNTALTVGSVRVRIVYEILVSLDNA
jgi:hypothetical protein